MKVGSGKFYKVFKVHKSVIKQDQKSIRSDREMGSKVSQDL